MGFRSPTIYNKLRLMKFFKPLLIFTIIIIILGIAFIITRKSVIIPNKLIQYSNGQVGDTVNNLSENVSFNKVLYINGDCIHCASDFLNNYQNSISEKETLIIVSSTDLELFTYIFKKFNSSTPIYIDISNEFKRINRDMIHEENLLLLHIMFNKVVHVDIPSTF